VRWFGWRGLLGVQRREQLGILSFTAPIMEATAGPIGEVHLGDEAGQWCCRTILQSGQNRAVWETILKHLIDLIAQGFGKAGDFSVTGPPVESVNIPDELEHPWFVGGRPGAVRMK
jgi:hypothetical protein